MQCGDEESDELATLRRDWPGWQFGTVWATAASGPDARRVYAQRGSVLLTAWDAPSLATCLRLEATD